jgi:hypothetical protein
MEATVTLVKGDPKVSENRSFARNWGLVFRIKAPVGSFSFNVGEPYLFTLHEWRCLASGGGKVCLYRDNGEGGISSDGKEMRFAVARGGDVATTYVVPRVFFGEALSAVLDEAEA